MVVTIKSSCVTCWSRAVHSVSVRLEWLCTPCTAVPPGQHLVHLHHLLHDSNTECQNQRGRQRHAHLHHPVSTMHSCITLSAPCTAASPGQHHAQLHHPVSTMHSCMTCCRGAVQTVNIRSERPLSSCTVASPWKWEGGECSRDCQSHVSMAVSDLDSCMHGHGEGGSNIGMARAQATAAGGHRAYRTRAY